MNEKGDKKVKIEMFLWINLWSLWKLIYHGFGTVTEQSELGKQLKNENEKYI